MSNELAEAIISLQGKLNDEQIDGSIKFEIEGIGSIVINNGSISESSDETDCTLIGSIETFKEIFSGELNSTTAFMGGRLKVEGSMGIAMKYNSILS
jgi:putative sterol carrier protein